MPLAKRNPVFILNNKPLEVVSSFKYLGIIISYKGDVSGAPRQGGEKRAYKDFLSDILSKAEKRVNLVCLLGSHMDGLHPVTASRLYKSLIRPILEFGGQLISYNEAQVRKLEVCQNKTLRRLLGFHVNTKIEIVRRVAGVEPIEARLH